jgi:hypothetical protein
MSVFFVPVIWIIKELAVKKVHKAMSDAISSIAPVPKTIVIF